MRVAKERAILRQRLFPGHPPVRWAGARLIVLLAGLLWPPPTAATPVLQEPATRLTPPVPIMGLETGPATALEFSRAWLTKAEAVRQRRAELLAAGKLDGVSPDSLAKLGAALSGKLRIPVIPVRYSNVAEPFPHTLLQDRIFGTAHGDSVSLASYWKEVSGGLLEVEGGVTPWVRLGRPGSYYLPKEEYGWASFGRAHELVRDALRSADRLVDFTGFDNDGPDGIPNSGDDDGFVDLVIILYAVPCTGAWQEGSVWPHRGAIPPMNTSARAAGGGRIQVADYLILPVQEPGSCEPLQVGVLAHETGHALGLPDLYEYDGTSQGAGSWDLMGRGSHSALHSPAHLSAWSKEQLGWVRVDWLRPGQESLKLSPVVRDRTILRYDIPDARGEYLLFENRQRLGSDSYLPGTGLLAWRVQPDRAELGAWNGIGRYRGVELISAGDGTAASSNSGDPFPGAGLRDHLDLGAASQLRLTGIRQEWGGEIAADISTGYTTPTLLATAPLRLALLPGDTALTRTITIRREGGVAGNWTPTATAAWARVHRMGDLLMVSADPAGLAPGIYTDTIRLTLPAIAATGASSAASTVNAGQTALKSAGDDAATATADTTGPATTKAADPTTANSGATSPRPAPAAATAETGGTSDTTTGAAARKAAPAGAAADTRMAGSMVIQLEIADPALPAVVSSDVPWGWGLAVERGHLFQASFRRDALSLQPRPLLLRLPGRGHAVETLARLPVQAIYAPVAGPHGTIYLLGQTDSQNQIFQVHDDGRAEVLATLPGAAPVYGAVGLPDGRILVADWDGRIRQVTPDGRVAPWIELGAKIYQIAVDNEGILYAAAHSGNLLRLDPTGRLTTIATGLGTGRLVTVAAAPDGAIFAAERGGAGRILRIMADGTRTEVARIDDAEFYGLAADERFLYALDLFHREILRFPLAGLAAPRVIPRVTDDAAAGESAGESGG